MKINLNLATRPYVNRRALLAGYLIAALLLLAAAAFLLTMVLQSRRQTVNVVAEMGALQKRSGLDQPLPQGAAYTPAAQAELEKRISFANELLERDHFHWTELLDRLEETTLAGISIEGLQPEFKSGLVKISGRASDLGRLRQFLDRLAASPHFSDVLLLRQGRDKQEGNQVSFSLTLKRGGGA
jgi:type IV pilus assembly protein PilN